MLNYLFQCINTTKNARNIDLKLAYFAGSEWLKFKYPEYYDEEDVESFCKDCKCVRIK